MEDGGGYSESPLGDETFIIIFIIISLAIGAITFYLYYKQGQRAIEENKEEEIRKEKEVEMNDYIPPGMTAKTVVEFMNMDTEVDASDKILLEVEEKKKEDGGIKVIEFVKVERTEPKILTRDSVCEDKSTLCNQYENSEILSSEKTEDMTSPTSSRVLSEDLSDSHSGLRALSSDFHNDHSTELILSSPNHHVHRTCVGSEGTEVQHVQGSSTSMINKCDGAKKQWMELFDRHKREQADTLAEKLCRRALEQMYNKKFPKVRSEVPWLVNPNTGYPLELDGYCHELKMAFEYHGPHHREFPNWLSRKGQQTFEQFQELLIRDMNKASLCEENDVYLIIVDFTTPNEQIFEKIKTLTPEYIARHQK